MLEFLLNAIGIIVRVLIVPAVFIGIIFLAWRIARLATGTNEQQISSRLALLLGVAIFALVAVLNIYAGLFVPTVKLNAFQQPLWYVGGGFIAGLVFMGLIHSLLRIRAIPIFVTILTSTGLVGLYFYIFVQQYRDPLLISTVSLLVGAVLYAVLAPDVLDGLRIDVLDLF